MTGRTGQTGKADGDEGAHPAGRIHIKVFSSRRRESILLSTSLSTFFANLRRSRVPDKGTLAQFDFPRDVYPIGRLTPTAKGC